MDEGSKGLSEWLLVENLLRVGSKILLLHFDMGWDEMGWVRVEQTNERIKITFRKRPKSLTTLYTPLFKKERKKNP